VDVSPKTAAAALIARLSSPSAAIRQVAATAIRQTGDRRAIKPLRALLNDSNPAVREQAKMSLQFLDR
jgi:HEAT repeat protein